MIKCKRRHYRDSLKLRLNHKMEYDPQNAWKIIIELKNETLLPDKLEKIIRTQWFLHFEDHIPLTCLIFELLPFVYFHT